MASQQADEDVDQVLTAALALVEADGLKALTLRPLAERMGATVSALSYRFGRKDDLVAVLIAAAAREEAGRLARWTAALEAIARPDAQAMADFVETVLDEWTGRSRLLALFFSELLQAAAARPEVRAPLEAWKRQRLAFWRDAAGRIGRPALGEALHAYAADEAAHGLALGDDPAYRWLRRLVLRRLCCGLAAHDGAAEVFPVLHAGLGDLLADAAGRYQARPVGEAQAAVAERIGALIIAAGADAVTHRAVAAAAQIPPSTLAYSFPRQEDLLKAGLESIIRRLQGRVDQLAPRAGGPGADMSTVEVGRGTFAVALAAVRIPSLRGFAADMRRRRGENYYAYMVRAGGDAEPALDRAAAQALSMVGIGQVMLQGGLDVRSAQDGTDLLVRLLAEDAADRGA